MENGQYFTKLGNTVGFSSESKNSNRLNAKSIQASSNAHLLIV